MRGSPLPHFDACFVKWRGQNLDVLSRFGKMHHFGVYLAESSRINRQIFSARAFSVRGIPSWLCRVDSARKIRRTGKPWVFILKSDVQQSFEQLAWTWYYSITRLGLDQACLKCRLLDIPPSSVRGLRKRDQIASEVVNDAWICRARQNKKLKALTVDESAPELKNGVRIKLGGRCVDERKMGAFSPLRRTSY